MSEVPPARDVYSSEIRQLPRIPRDAQAEYVEAARLGDEEAAHALLTNCCLNPAFATAMRLHKAYEPRHTDADDLIGHSNLVMMEALPRAITKHDPVAYLVSAAANEQRRLCTRGDSLIKKPMRSKYLEMVPETVPLDEARDKPAPSLVESDPSLVLGAVKQLSKRRQQALMGFYGLDGTPRRNIQELAQEAGVTPGAIAIALQRAKQQLAQKLAPHVSKHSAPASALD